jgi:hypothetical protein
MTSRGMTQRRVFRPAFERRVQAGLKTRLYFVYLVNPPPAA